MKLHMMVIAILLSGASAYAQKSEEERFQAAQRQYAAGQFSEAEKGFTEITREDPKNIAAQMFLGQTLFREEKFAEAIHPYETVRALEKAGGGWPGCRGCEVSSATNEGCPRCLAFGHLGYRYDASTEFDSSVGCTYDAAPRLSFRRRQVARS